MVNDNKMDDLVRKFVQDEFDAIDVPEGLKEDVWEQVQTTKKPKRRYKKLIPYLAMAACLAILLPLGLNQFQHQATKSSQSTTQAGHGHTQTQTQTNKKAVNKRKESAKRIAESFLTNNHYNIISYDGERTLSLTMAMLNNQPNLKIKLLTMNADILKDDIQLEGASLLANPIKIETFTISGFWRERYLSSDTTKVAVVVTGQTIKTLKGDEPIVGGYTVPADKSHPQDIWPLYSPATDATVVAKGNMKQEAIAKELFSQFLEKMTRSDFRSDGQISKYKMKHINIYTKTLHGFHFNVQYEVLPAHKDNFVIAGGEKQLKNGWVSDEHTAQVFKVNNDTYLLMGVGSGPISDVNSSDVNRLKNGPGPKTTKNPLYRMTLTLPNGRIVHTDESAKWKDLNIGLWILGNPQPPQDKKSTEYKGYLQSVVGNHSEVLSSSQIDTSAGKAVLILNKRTPPAALQSIKVTYEYWVVIYKNQVTYAIKAQVTGDRSVAKQEVMELVKHWKIP